MENPKGDLWKSAVRPFRQGEAPRNAFEAARSQAGRKHAVTLDEAPGLEIAGVNSPMLAIRFTEPLASRLDEVCREV